MVKYLTLKLQDVKKEFFKVIYPENVSQPIHIILGFSVIIINLLIYGWILLKRKN